MGRRGGRLHPAGIRREYAEYAPAGTRRAYPNPRRKAPAFAPRRFLTTFSSEGGDRGAAGPRARAAPWRDPSATRTLPCAALRSASASPHRIRAYLPVFRQRHLTRFRALHARSGRITRRWGLRGSGQHGAAARVFGGDDVRDACAAGGRGYVDYEAMYRELQLRVYAQQQQQGGMRPSPGGSPIRCATPTAPSPWPRPAVR